MALSKPTDLTNLCICVRVGTSVMYTDVGFIRVFDIADVQCRAAAYQSTVWLLSVELWHKLLLHTSHSSFLHP